jgi:hypothetical protein
MIGSKLFGSGLNTLSVLAMVQDVGTSISAAGTTQGTATSLTNATNVLSTVTSGAGCVLLSTAGVGDEQLVFNGGANAVKIYPPSGMKINSLPADTAVYLGTNSTCRFTMVTLTQWVAELSA